ERNYHVYHVLIFDHRPKRTLNSKKYGVNLIQFTHSPTTAIHASTKIDDTIRYLSLHDNKYIRYFQSHTKRVVSLCMSPIDDTFLSGSMDSTIRLWDLRSPNCHVIPNTDRQTLHASFTPDSQFVLIGSPDGVVHIWSVETGVRVASLPGYEAATQLPNAAIHSLAFNPRFAMLATGSNQTSFWLPALEE
ncbi:COMPASS component SWD2, partial [Schistosoma bovis]